MPSIKLSLIGRAALISAVLVSGHAYAEAESQGMAAPCGKRAYMDADGDGKVTRQEFMQGHEKKFDQMDANGDGVLDADERGAHHRQMKGKMMKKDGCPRGMGKGMGRPAE